MTTEIIAKELELMAPAGTFAAMQAAIDNGADSVYFGVEQLNMRARATMNFGIDDLEEVVQRCSEKGVKSYITLNTIMYDHDTRLYKRIIEAAHDAGISAVIASDQGVIMHAKIVGIPVHISTQLNVTNIETVMFYAPFADVMVLSRELTLTQVSKIRKAIIKLDVRGPKGELVRLEVFGHGALCMAVSGKCFMSLHTFNSSANRGACLQNCRRKYTVIDKEEGFELDIDNEYIMSPKDLCTIGFLDKFRDAGIGVLKIEGRGKAPEYVATTTRCYREAIDALKEGTYTEEKIEAWTEELATVFNRGFWDGYYLGQKMGEWTNKSGGSTTRSKTFIGRARNFFAQPKVGEFLVEANSFSTGDSLLITGPTTGVIEFDVGELRVKDEVVNSANRGDNVTFVTNLRVRKNDRLYKMENI